MIELVDVTFRYKDEKRTAIENVSSRFDCTGISCLVGRSGVGKSTLLAILAGIYLPGDPAVEEFRGEIKLDGLWPSQLRGARLASWVPQAAILLDHLTVSDNISL